MNETPCFTCRRDVSRTALTVGANIEVSSNATLVSSDRFIVFYTVQDFHDCMRLIERRDEWPGGCSRAALGEGLYTWSDKTHALEYAADKAKEIGGVTALYLLPIAIAKTAYGSLNTLRLDLMDDEAATSFLRYYQCEPRRHGFPHFVRGVTPAKEFYFSPTVYQEMMTPLQPIRLHI